MVVTTIFNDFLNLRWSETYKIILTRRLVQFCYFPQCPSCHWPILVSFCLNMLVSYSVFRIYLAVTKNVLLSFINLYVCFICIGIAFFETLQTAFKFYLIKIGIGRFKIEQHFKPLTEPFHDRLRTEKINIINMFLIHKYSFTNKYFLIIFIINK